MFSWAQVWGPAISAIDGNEQFTLLVDSGVGGYHHHLRSRAYPQAESWIRHQREVNFSDNEEVKRYL